MRKIIVSLSIAVLAGTAAAELRLAPLFNDGAVLQCDMPVNVWGTAEPGESVTVTFAGQEKTVVASGRGEWQVQLDPMAPSSEPRTLVVVSQISGLTVTSLPAVASRQPLPSAVRFQVSNVVVGEVWLATGQSNMVMPLRNSHGGEERLTRTIPEIRFMKVPQQTGLPPEPMTTEQLKWKSFEPGSGHEIAAVAFYFAESLQQKVGGVIGIIQSSYGGTPAEAWTPEWALDGKPELAYLANQIRKGAALGKSKQVWQKEADDFMDFWRARREWAKTKNGPAPEPVPQPGQDNPWNSKSPTVLYENMIRPLVPYTARGVIWYQGESNAGKPDEYRVLFPAMIEAWRTAWGRPDWPFLFVQLAAFDHVSQDWPGLRAAQTFTRDTVAHTGMALAIDCGDQTDIHPWTKQPVGERLARLALDQVYGQETVSRGPAFESLEEQNNGILVRFRYSGKGLQTSDQKAVVPGFEVAGEDGIFHSAEARLVSKDSVFLTCGAALKPQSVRYAWANWVEPPVTLQNSEGLPAEPFAAEIGDVL